MEVIKKAGDQLSRTLVLFMCTTVATLSLVYFVVLDYVDARVELAVSEKTAYMPKIKVMSLTDLAEKLRKEHYSDDEIIEYIDIAVKLLTDGGYVIINSDAVYASPTEYYFSAPTIAQLRQLAASQKLQD